MDFTLLTVKQVAAQLKVTIHAVHYWIKKGQLPATNSRPILIKYKDLNAFIEARMKKAR
jgi:excisionase family DNA binding protein